MRLGAHVEVPSADPEAWIATLRDFGYSAAYCPLPLGTCDEAEIRRYADVAAAADIVIAEVGAWSNPLSSDDAERSAAIDKCIAALVLAESIGARCCVNISGARGPKWDGPDEKNLTPETFDMIVEVVRNIIDAVEPKRTFYTLETMPWAYPDSADSYLELLCAIDRKAVAVHFDPVNLVCSPQRYFANGDLIRDCFAKLGPHIRSCHAKDIILHEKLTTHLDEVRPGQGNLDYATFLTELSKLDDRDTPLMIEHLPMDQYPVAAEHIRTVARQTGVTIL